MDRTTIVLESMENYDDIIRGVQESFHLIPETRTTNGMILCDNKNHEDIKVTGRIDDDEETTTIAIECKDKRIAEDIRNWVKENYS
ncbi:MAG: hypothetical protein GX895_00205 [Clostridiales bacterium]|nr:hypothetical protein [Clostridiales bacterium]